MHIFYVQGGGLGHLARIDRLIRLLNIPSAEVLIITPSAFTKYFKAYSYINISWKASAESWTQTISEVLSRHEIKMFYIDAFPLGIKGELIPIFKTFKTINYIYVSRILKWEAYLNAMPEVFEPKFHKILVIEHLYETHYKWLSKQSLQLENIDIYTNFHSEVSTKSLKKPYALVVHSGGVKDLLKLYDIAKNDSQLERCNIYVFTQVTIDYEDPLTEFRTGIYPVSGYFKEAIKIYTAAGFNSIHELKPYRYKHVAMAFDKLYDDQFYRLENFKKSSGN